MAKYRVLATFFAFTSAKNLIPRKSVRRETRQGRPVCCAFDNLIVGNHGGDTKGQADGEDADGDNLDEDGLNPNQVRAVESSENPLALIWGPPGTVEIPLCVNSLTVSYAEGSQILKNIPWLLGPFLNGCVCT